MLKVHYKLEGREPVTHQFASKVEYSAWKEKALKECQDLGLGLEVNPGLVAEGEEEKNPEEKSAE